MKYQLILLAFLLTLSSCEQSTAPECYEGDFCIEDLDVTFEVRRNDYGNIYTHLMVKYKFKFKREGIIEYQIQDSVLTGYRRDPYHHDEIYKGGTRTYSGGFGTAKEVDYSHLKYTKVTIGFEGKYNHCSEDNFPFYKSCNFSWVKTMIVPVENFLTE